MIALFLGTGKIGASAVEEARRRVMLRLHVSQPGADSNPDVGRPVVEERPRWLPRKAILLSRGATPMVAISPISR